MSPALGAATASKKVLLAEDVPWRASPSGKKPVPRIHQNPVLRLPQNPNTSYALAVMKHPNPIGEGFAMEAKLEGAGPDCIIPGQVTPVKLLGLKVWPINVDLKFIEPVGRELRSIGKLEGFIGCDFRSPQGSIHGFSFKFNECIISRSLGPRLWSDKGLLVCHGNKACDYSRVMSPEFRCDLCLGGSCLESEK